jgi:two-component system, OmpR family, phosphate regulon response regulator OmpR
MSKYHVLLVEDDEKIKILLKKFFTQSGYLVSTASDIKECEKLISYFTLDVIVMDVMLPGEDGANFVKRYVKNGLIPIIMLSAVGSIDNKISALESGAKDYMTKPFDPRELSVRIKNIMLLNKNNNKSDEKLIEFGTFKFDDHSGNLYNESGLVHLTNSEKDLLVILVGNIGNPISRDELLRYFPNLNERSIDALISRLRSKIEINPKKSRHLQTLRGRGYIFWQ